MSRPFRSSNPNLYNSDYIRNKKGEVRYNNMVNIAINNKCSSYDGKTKIDSNGNLRQTDSYETLRSFRYGRALCPPCDISGLVTEPGDISGVLNKCPCRIAMTDRMRSTLYHMLDDLPQLSWDTSNIMKAFEALGIGPDYMYLPWNPLQHPDSRNANDTWWAPEDKSSTELIFSIMDVSDNAFGSCPFGNIVKRARLDNSGVGIPETLLAEKWMTNTLPFMDASGDCSGSFCGPSLVSIYGGHMKVRGTVIRGCARAHNTSYLPPGTFAFSVRDLLSSWLYLWESVSASNPGFPLPSPLLPITLSNIIDAFHAGGIYGARPPTTQDSYLRNFARRGPLRFYRSKDWYA